jgi:hypothetical protein
MNLPARARLAVSTTGLRRVGQTPVGPPCDVTPKAMRPPVPQPARGLSSCQERSVATEHCPVRSAASSSVSMRIVGGPGIREAGAFPRQRGSIEGIMGANPDPACQLHDIAELANSLRRGNTIEYAAEMLGRDADQGQKAYDLGLIDQSGAPAVTRSPLASPKPSRRPSSSEIAPWPLRASQPYLSG